MPRKSLGQHFLIDQDVLIAIAESAELTTSDTVLEIGPGHGVLTKELTKRAKNVVAIEIDGQLAETLSSKLGHPKNLNVINGDARSVELPELIGSMNQYKVLANLPYYAATFIIRRFLEAVIKPSLMVVMVQKEVADSMIGKPGKMSLLGSSVQFYGFPRIISLVPSEAFYPKPKVTSAVIRIDLFSNPKVKIDDSSQFFKLVSAGFSAPRKQILNSLSLGLKESRESVSEILTLSGISGNRRPSTLSIRDWELLYRAYQKRSLDEG